VDVNALRGLFTVIAMLAFLGVVWWAYRSGNRRRFEEDALLPFLDDAHDASDAGDREE
jgi:cytochrome c oxidase cbb3-type subunit 4